MFVVTVVMDQVGLDDNYTGDHFHLVRLCFNPHTSGLDNHSVKKGKSPLLRPPYPPLCLTPHQIENVSQNQDKKCGWILLCSLLTF